MVTPQVVLKIYRLCVQSKIATKVEAVTMAEVVVPDLVDVDNVAGLFDIDLASVN
jgi:hypothetical protein